MYNFDIDYDAVDNVNSFIFSLRKNGNSNKEKFSIKYQNNHCQIYNPNEGPIFCSDIFICNKSNQSVANIGTSYDFPTGYPSIAQRDYLAGSYN